MNILHVASFLGNIGDNASHLGFYNLLSNYFGIEAKIDQVEIRKFYKNYSLPDKKSFNEDFVKMANEYDLLVFGGGGFLDFWVPDSKTGTTIDISLENFEAINTPIALLSMGSIPHKNVPEGNIEKFQKFLDVIFKKENCFLALRNDGSLKVIEKYFGSNYSDKIPEVLDFGFFFENTTKKLNLVESPFILINTSLDQLSMNNEILREVNEQRFNDEMTKFLNYVFSETSYQVVFVPHIYGDLKSFFNILQSVPDFLIRKRVSVAPYLTGFNGAEKLFSLYQNSEINIGMRFHSNICSLSLKTPSIGLCGLDRVLNMYESVNLNEDSFVRLDSDFSEDLIQKFRSTQEKKENFLSQRKATVEKNKQETATLIKQGINKILYNDRI